MIKNKDGVSFEVAVLFYGYLFFQKFYPFVQFVFQRLDSLARFWAKTSYGLSPIKNARLIAKTGIEYCSKGFRNWD